MQHRDLAKYPLSTPNKGWSTQLLCSLLLGLGPLGVQARDKIFGDIVIEGRLILSPTFWARSIGQAADIYRSSDYLNIAFVDVTIADDYCESRKSSDLTF